MTAAPFVPPPYPYDRLNALKSEILELHGSVVDLSIGTPIDDPPDSVVAAFAAAGAAKGYPPSVGTPGYLDAIQRWFLRRFSVEVAHGQIGATIGSKEFVASLPQYMKLRTPDRDTVLYPAISYPTYEMGAILAGLRPVAVPMLEDGRLDLATIDPADVERALLIWVNSPGNPTGQLDDLEAVAAWGRTHRVPVFSDECYVEFTWDGPGRTILEHGVDGVVSVHSLSKRSNFAGARAGFYAGDPELVGYLREVRKHAGLMVPGPVQLASIVALDDDEHVSAQRDRYRRRLERLAGVLTEWSGIHLELPAGAFYLWIPVADGWQFTRDLARAGGALVSPGEFYGSQGAGHVRIAVVQRDEQIDLVVDRLRRHAQN